jgi:hypothetical protein
MLTFFRRLRQRFLEENRITRYLIYAFGEIILVVVGILIAIQFNTLKEESDKQQQTKLLLSQVLIDLKADSTRFEELYTYYAGKSYAMQRLFAVSQEEMQISNDSLGDMFRAMLHFKRYFQSASTFESMVATNHIQFIRDNQLVDKLMNYYGVVYLSVSTELYANIVAGRRSDISQSLHYKAADRILPDSTYAQLPEFVLSESRPYKTDFTEMLEEPWAQHFLVLCLNQSVYVFDNLARDKVRNQSLANDIRRYLKN